MIAFSVQPVRQACFAEGARAQTQLPRRSLSSVRSPSSCRWRPPFQRASLLDSQLIPAGSWPMLAGAAALGGSAALLVLAGSYSASSSSSNRMAAIEATRTGMNLFREGDVEGSLVLFDKAKELDPSQIPYLWQRGLSLYYAGRYQEAAEQFRADVAVNPNDTEESIWCFLSEAMESSPEEARAKFLEVGKDSRPIMRAAYELFKTGKPGPGELLDLVSKSPGSGTEFYGYLYTGLYYESERKSELAKDYIVKATTTQYAWMSGDYMAALAKVHCTVRGWT